MNKNKTVSFYTLGCRLNQAETALIEESFIQAGYQVVPFSKQADMCIINSCTVTDKGDADCRKTVRRYKRLNPKGNVAVVGCYSQVAADEVSNIPGVNLVVGNREKMELASLLNDIDLNQAQPQILKESLKKEDSFVINITNANQAKVRANLKIQDGCDFFCSYCIIPFARGRAYSRKMDNLLEEANQLVENGHQELVLTGINVGTYNYNSQSFLDVIKELEKIPALKRIRISSIENTTFN
ncbi:MAG: radical SAM protein, partial [Calditrichia bacterium]|nr:radical SAM protein [Calditrichia bacterium]